MSTSARRVSFGIKTSQSNVTYDQILKIWLEAEQEPVFEHAWLGTTSSSFVVPQMGQRSKRGPCWRL